MEAAGRQRGQGERALALLPQTAGPREAEAHPRPHAPHLAAAVPQQPRVGRRLGARPAGRAGPAQPVRRQQHRLLLPQIAAGAPAAGPGKPCGLLSRPSAPRGRGPGLTATAGPHGGSSGAEQRGRCRDCGRPAPRARLPGLRVTSEDRADRRGDFAGHWAAADAPGLVGPSRWPPTRPQTQLRKLHPQEGGGLQPKTPVCLHAQAPASPVPAHRSLLPRGRVCSRHLPSHT